MKGKERCTFCGLRHGWGCVLLVFLRLTACVTFFAFYFTVPLLFKAFRELKLPTKQGESGKEGDKPGGEKREGLTLETPLGFSKSNNKVWRDGGRDRDEGRDTSVCWQTCEGVVILQRVLHQLNRIPWYRTFNTISQKHHNHLSLSKCFIFYFFVL